MVNNTQYRIEGYVVKCPVFGVTEFWDNRGCEKTTGVWFSSTVTKQYI